ncbi:helix-turn-helix transcriptional regulator [Actinoallomurus sp. NBC_01490]|uniref:helix-turn-helix transcriptional regulator n=1 Tax=Actinoallomurus sp. NBC_01490 TaxID=2903557 RepID=UPI002E3088CF|nr:helix-turn-helix transcriptional regulator [Actinoallomurus sp. NBC_01490]
MALIAPDAAPAAGPCSIRPATSHATPRAALAERLAAHAALAAALTGSAEADHRAWRLAKATVGTDDRVAAELEHTARRARERGGYEAAARAYDQAARLSSTPADQARRLTLAGEAAAETARLNDARAAAERAAALAADPPLLARIARVRATADFKQGRPRSAHALLTEGAVHIAGTDPHQELRMHLTAANAAWIAGDTDLLAVTAARLTAFEPPDGDPMASVHAFLVWMTRLALGSPAGTLPPPGRVVTEAREAAVRCPHDLSFIGIGGLVAGQERHTRDVLAAMAAESRVRGRLGWLAAMLSLQSTAEVLLGEHTNARTTAQEALRLALDTGLVWWIRYANGILAYLAAVEGDEDSCQAHAADALGGPAAAPGGTWAHWALALLDLGAGHAERAVTRLDLAARGPVRFGTPLTRGIPDVVEALVRQAMQAEAADALTHLTDWAFRIDQPSVDALVARCRALLTPDAEDHYRTALDLHEKDPRPFEQARTALLYGEWLRRRRRKGDARPYLSSARGTFESLGAHPWAKRASAELGATGARRSPGSATRGLTPQELQVSRLAAQGLSNKEIAARLFLSRRTVGYHLNKAYPKLGVLSRKELATVPLA